MRVHEMAKFAGVSSKAVMAYLDFIGIYVKSASSKVADPLTVASVIFRLQMLRKDEQQIFELVGA